MNSTPEAAKPPAKILVVDDDAANTAVISCILSAQGYDVTSATTGREAMRLLGQDRFAVVVTDLLMPDMDGIELIANIRKMTRRPLIIAASGGGMSYDASQPLSIAVKMGAVGKLTKPFTADQLLRAVSEALAGSGTVKPAST